MSTVLGHVNNWLRFSSVDGPGNRFVVFMQGCNFDCAACHNPYTISMCSSCGVCVDRCPETALSSNGLIAVDWTACTRCDICVEVCPENSTPLSTYLTVASLIDEISAVAPFISGITVSGGEATLQPEFVAALFTTIRTTPRLAHLTTFIDSNGAATREVWDRLAPVMDGAMIDLKAFDSETHRGLTGAGNDLVLDSIAYLAERQLLHEVRLLILPDRNDDRETLGLAAQWLRTVDPAMRIKIIGFRRHGTRPQAHTIAEPTTAELEEVRIIFASAGFAHLEVV